MLSGIYKFQNKVNGKVYIGQASNIEIRWRGHFNNHTNANLADYETHFYRGLRKYGWDNFDKEVLEYCKVDLLNEREIYWIEYYNSFKEGYNSNRGGEAVTERGEDHPLAKLTNIQVLEIKEILKTTLISQKIIGEMYNISAGTIKDINVGNHWSHIGDYTYPIRPTQGRKGADNPRSAFTEEEVIEIRQRYVNETGTQIYQDYQDRCAYSTLERVLLGKTFAHLPVYSKVKKEWINK